jgi:dTDP-4-amino-4,6-dideoxy-D-galactose acyltransferase
MLSVKELDFDTQVFGFRVGRLELQNHSDVEIESSLNEAYSQTYRLIYTFAREVEVAQCSEAVDAKGQSATTAPHQLSTIPGLKVDCKTTYQLLLSTKAVQDIVQGSFSNISSFCISSVPKAAILPDTLIELSLESGRWSRFGVDTNVPGSVYSAIFRGWITNSVNRSMADEVFVARDTTSGSDVGLITLKRRETDTNIGLLAVCPAYRNRGIASMLLYRAALWCLEQTSWSTEATLSVVTQGANIAACKCYEKFGFSVRTTQDVYHTWLPLHLEEPKRIADRAIIPFCKQFFTGKEQEYISQVS